jgi:hypothetical protein
MGRATLVLNSPKAREKAANWIRQAPFGTRLEFKASRRTIPQNDLMWALLTDLSVQVTWHGVKLSPADWKLMMLSGLKKELRIVPNLDGDGFVNLGNSSSDLSKSEMTDLIELILHFGAERGVKFHDDKKPKPSDEELEEEEAT